MQARKVLAVALIVAGFISVIPTSVMADMQGKPISGGKVTLFGTVDSATAKSFVLDTATAQITVNIKKLTVFRPLSAAAAVSGFLPGDAAIVAAHSGKAVAAKTVTFDVAAFPVPKARRTFTGIFASNTDTSVTITNKSGQASFTFNVDGATKYLQDGTEVTTPAYASGDRVVVKAQEFTNASWLGKAVAIRSPHKH